MLTRENIAAAAKPKTKVVDVPEWEGSVTIRALTAAEILRLNVSTEDKHGGARSIIASVVEESGDLTFAETPENIALVEGFSAAGFVRLSKAINEFNGLSADLEKN